MIPLPVIWIILASVWLQACADSQGDVSKWWEDQTRENEIEPTNPLY
jgi:hypothetical protein